MTRTADFADESEQWAAVTRRDPQADGQFFYSVSTTGVYCRPSCPSRQARREHVRFHSTIADAERAGFRACKRCRPNEPARADQHAAAVARACRLIERTEALPSLDALADAAGMSRFHFHRVFKSVTGLTPRAYAGAHRAHRVREALGRRPTVTEAIYEAGFNSNGPFYAAAPAVLGMTPSRFRAGGAGASIRFAVGECSLGSVLVGATDKGVCAILLGDDPAVLVRNLEDRFPKAQLIGADAAFERLVAHVVGLVEAPGAGSSACGRRCARFLRDRRRAMRRSPGASAHRRRCAASLGPARPIRWPSPSPVIASCAATARWRATAGA
jgi:AraC family transcriptional regulator of adaptative response/methylated-DNA-[protein]-cysteine methyltransferase